MKKIKIFSLATAALVAFSAMFVTLPKESPLTASAAETKTLSLNTQKEAANIKAKLSWKFSKPVSRWTTHMEDDYSKATATLNIARHGYTYSNIKIGGVDFKNQTTASVSAYRNSSTVYVNKNDAEIQLPIEDPFTVTAEVIANSSDLTSKDAWQSRIDNDELDAILDVDTSRSTYFKPGDQTVKPTIEAVGISSTLTFNKDSVNRNYFSGTRDYVIGSTSFTDAQKRDILNAANIDVTLNLSKAPISTTGVTLYLSSSGIRSGSDAEKLAQGAASRDMRTITFHNVKLNPTGSSTSFFNHFAVVAEAPQGGGNSPLHDINVTSITATLNGISDTTTAAATTTASPAPLPAPAPVPAFVPGVAQNVRAAHYATAIDVRWDPVTSARYGVYYIHFDKKGNPSSWTVKAVNTNTYSIPNPVYGATYYITILPFGDNPRQYGGFSPYTIVKID